MPVARIAVMSDTHIPKAASDLPESLYKELGSVDLILHAGDFVEIQVLENLKKIAPVHAVHGNMDSWEIKAALSDKEVIEVERFKIGLIHGYGSPGRLIFTVSNEFKNVDVIVFGHSHCPFLQKVKKTLFMNPGSPTDKIFAPYNTYGILKIREEITGEIIKL